MLKLKHHGPPDSHFLAVQYGVRSCMASDDRSLRGCTVTAGVIPPSLGVAKFQVGSAAEPRPMIMNLLKMVTATHTCNQCAAGPGRDYLVKRRK